MNGVRCATDQRLVGSVRTAHEPLSLRGAGPVICHQARLVVQKR